MPPRTREHNPHYGGRQSPINNRNSPSPILTEDDDGDEDTISQEDEDDEDEDEDEEEDEDEDEDEEDEEDDDDEQETTGGSSMPEASLEGLKEIGNLASWTVSTAKPGNGVEQLRDEDTNLFWQQVLSYNAFILSDGPQPHMINIHFAKRVFVKRIRMFLDFENDESYTPTKISIMSGTGYHDLQEVTTMNFEQPSGWIDVPLEGVHKDGQLRTFLIQVCIHANHQNGKDTHVRGLQIFSLEPPSVDQEEIPFMSGKMISELELR
ncbi:APC10-domain-containing protein [Morchella conica CCBAS932]|uniref:APC10-domain-containing protein n=1 Tax=Morchella conica CCBAS932 TaxID=1392247 RepID=A0A3N4KUR5_9PEZI|nr:APC10-domain-containing protein [Morchella conica CCBAS932]